MIPSEEKQRELSEVFHMLDPLDLFQQVEQLHQAFLHHAVTLFSSPLRTPAPALLATGDLLLSQELPALSNISHAS